MDYAKLNLSFRKYGIDCIRKSFESIDARNQDIGNSSTFQITYHSKPEFGSFIFSYIHSKHIFVSFQIDSDDYIASLVYDMSLISDLVMYGIKEYYCIY
jgi:hypothetical protein